MCKIVVKLRTYVLKQKTVEANNDLCLFANKR